MCVYGVPLASVYKGWRRRRPAKAIGAARMGVLLGLQVLVGVHQEGRKGEGSGGVGKVAGPLFPSPIRTRGEGGRSRPFLLFPLKPIKAQYFSQRIPVTLRYSEKYSDHSEPFRCPNIVVQYIDFYVSTISRLLVMSPISSGTPNYLRYIKTHKLIIYPSSNFKRADPTGSRTM